LPVEVLKGGWVVADQFDQLAGGDLQGCCGRGRLPFFHCKPIHGDRQHAGEINVGAGECNAFIPHPALPEFLACSRQILDRTTYLDRQLATELEDRGFLIRCLGSKAMRLRNDTTGTVLDDNRRFDFVSVLPTGSPAAASLNMAFGQQLVDW
jgi:hypothetical protein